MEPLTVCTPTYNSADCVERALDSVTDIADEIVVLDSDSTDGTRDIVRDYDSVALYDYEFEGFAHMFRTAATKASNDWVLYVDADEEVREPMASEIRRKLTDPTKDAYETFKRNRMWGRWMHAKHKKRPILARVEALSWDDAIVGEEWRVRDGYDVGELEHPIHHYAYDSVDGYITKWMGYTAADALDEYESGRSSSLLYFYLKGAAAFNYRYFYERSVLDGWQGLFFSVMSAVFYPVVDARLRRIQKLQQERDDWREWWIENKC